MRVRIIMEADVDEDLLARTGSRDQPPYGLDPTEWQASDLRHTLDETIIDADADTTTFEVELLDG